MKAYFLLVMIMLSAYTASAFSETRIELDETKVQGASELPKVLYIVPWKKAELGELPGRPVNSLVNEILEPVDRDEFRRRIDYYDTLFGTQVTDSSGSDE